MATYTTEIASDKLVSDNPIHQRLLKAYIAAKPWISGNLLEVGCGEGRGVDTLLPLADGYLGIDKIGEIIQNLENKYPNIQFEQAVIPPFSTIQDSSFSTVVSFQVIEHIQDDKLFLEEIYRVLKPGGTAIISTPNINFTLSRNPWHVREYKPEQLTALCCGIFDQVESRGIGGNKKVWAYHEANRASVQKIMQYDIFNLQYRLPASLLKIPYEFFNRRNRNKLHKQEGTSVTEIAQKDYLLIDDPSKALDLFYILHKK